MEERHPWPLGVHYHHINLLDYHPLEVLWKDLL